MDKQRIKKIVSKHRHEKAAILQILHEVQEEDKELDMDTQQYIAQLLNIPFANVYGLVTFYSAFSTTPKGDTMVRVCNGIACHLNGSKNVAEALKSHYKIEFGETTWNENYSLEKVECIGLCSIGPNVSFNDKIHTNLDRQKILGILNENMEDSE